MLLRAYMYAIMIIYLHFMQDLLIGAPYDGEDHRGAIYVYLGSSERKASGKEWSYAQVNAVINGIYPS